MRERVKGPTPFDKCEHLTVIGRIEKHANYRQTRSPDPDFILYSGLNNFDYANSLPNPEASTKAIKKYDHPFLEEPPDRVAFDKALVYLREDMRLRGKMLDHDAVINAMDFSTSPGFPWVERFPTKGDFVEDSTALMILKQYWRDFHTYSEPTFCVASALKEELRTLDKIYDNKIRQIAAFPIEAVYTFNRYFLDQNNKLYARHTQGPHAVGFSIFDGGWNNIYQKLAKFDQGFELDISSQDANFAPFMSDAICEWRVDGVTQFSGEFTPEVHRARMRQLYRENQHSMLVTPEGLLIEKVGGNNSGQPNTIVDNTAEAYLALSYAAIRMGYKKTEFHASVSFIILGDNVTITVHPDHRSNFSPENVSKYYQELGLPVKCSAWRSVEKLTFISHRFVMLRGVALPLPEDPYKLVASLALRSNKRGVAETIYRCCAILQMLCTHDTSFQLVDGYIQYLHDKYRTFYENDSEFQNAMSLRRSREVFIQHFLPVQECSS